MFLLFILSLSLHTVHTDSFTIQIGSFTTVTTITTKSSVHPSLFLPSPCPEHTDSSHCIQLPTLTTHPLSLSPITPFLGSPSLNCAFAVAVHHLSILQSTDHQILNLSSELGSSLVCFDYLFVIHPQHIHPYTPHIHTHHGRFRSKLCHIFTTEPPSSSPNNKAINQFTFFFFFFIFSDYLYLPDSVSVGVCC